MLESDENAFRLPITGLILPDGEPQPFPAARRGRVTSRVRPPLK